MGLPDGPHATSNNPPSPHVGWSRPEKMGSPPPGRALQGIPPQELLEARLPSAQQHSEQQKQQEQQSQATSATAAARSSTVDKGKRRGGGGGKEVQAAAAGVATQQQQPGDPLPPPPPDVVSAGVALLRRRVQRLASLVATGRVGIQVGRRAHERHRSYRYA